jgi:hypothetical protein
MKAGSHVSMTGILNFPVPDESPDEQAAFLENLSRIRRAFGTLGGDVAGGAPQ